MKKYRFQSVARSLVYLIIALVLIAFIVVCFLSDEIHSGVIFIISFFSICVIIITFWVGFSLSMRIQIDYEKKELYIKHSHFWKRLKFEEITSILILDYNEVAFQFIIMTKFFSKNIPYARYLHKRPSKKITDNLNELKQDLMNISNRNY